MNNQQNPYNQQQSMGQGMMPPMPPQGRVSTKEQIHFLEIAYGSLREVDCQLDIAKDLAYISVEEHLEIENKLEKVAALIAGMRNQRSASLNAKP